jgi:hypothetical protein
MRTYRSSALVALVVFAGLVACACGSTTTSSNSSTSSPTPSPTPSPSKIASVDACSLVKVDEASAVAGATVTNMGASGAVSIPGACFYATADGKTSVVVFAQVFPDASAAASVSPETIAASLNGAYGVANAKPVSGIGDKAVEYSTSGAQGAGLVIFVFKSNVVFLIAVTPSPSAPTALENLARTAAGRL